MADAIRLTFSDTLTAGLDRALAAGLDFTPAMRSIAALLEESVQYRFETGEAPDGTPWLPSARAKRDGGRTLVDTARLLGSITSAFDAMSAVVGTNVIYAAIHQRGGKISGKTRPDRPGDASSRAGTTAPLRTPFGPRASVSIPARPFLGFAPADRTAIEAKLAAHLGDAYRGAAA